MGNGRNHHRASRRNSSANLATGENRSRDKSWIVHRAETVLAEQFDELCQTALFVRTEVIVDVPAEVVLAEIVIVFGPVADDGIERVQAETFGLAQLPAQAAVLD